jgi:isoquinoline 1-oxidoreductase/isoquinoline 1-oxidoreductase beta subunit
MEPMSAVVHVRENDAEVWAGTQGPGAAGGLVARHAGLDPAQVTVHQTYLGGAFGRRGTLTHVVEATQISKATGTPVKLLWTREDDLRGGLYRPASLMRIRAGLDKSGQISAWDAQRAGANITPETLRNSLPALLPGMPEGIVDWVVGVADKAHRGWIVDHSSIEGLYEDYSLPNFAVRHATKEHGIPVTFWRSVGHSYTAFAKEVTMDALAEAAGADPVAFRLAHLKDNPRMARVVERAGEAMKSWPLKPGRSLGFAAHASFFTPVAQVAEVSVENGAIRVHRVFCAVDCGLAINPDIIRAQMEGAVMYGLTAALHGKLELENGAVKQSNFHDYPILRIDEAPAVEVVILDSQAAPTGVGEPGLPPIAPAVANAVYRATGKRLTELPLNDALRLA